MDNTSLSKRLTDRPSDINGSLLIFNSSECAQQHLFGARIGAKISYVSRVSDSFSGQLASGWWQSLNHQCSIVYYKYTLYVSFRNLAVIFLVWIYDVIVLSLGKMNLLSGLSKTNNCVYWVPLQALMQFLIKSTKITEYIALQWWKMSRFQLDHLWIHQNIWILALPAWSNTVWSTYIKIIF